MWMRCRIAYIFQPKISNRKKNVGRWILCHPDKHTVSYMRKKNNNKISRIVTNTTSNLTHKYSTIKNVINKFVAWKKEALVMGQQFKFNCNWLNYSDQKIDWWWKFVNWILIMKLNSIFVGVSELKFSKRTAEKVNVNELTENFTQKKYNKYFSSSVKNYWILWTVTILLKFDSPKTTEKIWEKMRKTQNYALTFRIRLQW